MKKQTLTVVDENDDDQRCWCKECDAMREAKDIYTVGHVNDGRGNPFLYCDVCDSEIGVLVNKSKGFEYRGK